MDEHNKIKEVVTNVLLYKNKDRIRGRKIGPSEIAAHCERRICYDRSKEAIEHADPETFNSIGAAVNGTALHEYFQTHVFNETDGFELVEAEKFISSEYINGYIDGVMKFTAADKNALLEIKTVHQVKFDKMKSSGKPLPEYIEQLTLYLGHEDIDEGWIFVVNRGIFERKTAMSRALLPIGADTDDMFQIFKVKLDKALYSELLDRAKHLKSLIDDFYDFGKLPSRPGSATPNGFPCLWCKFRHYCWSECYKEVTSAMLGEADSKEIMGLFSEHMKLRERAADINTKLEASEKAINKYFRENGGRGFSSIVGENFVIGTNGSPYIYKKADRPAEDIWNPNADHRASGSDAEPEVITEADIIPEQDIQRPADILSEDEFMRSIAALR